MQRLLLFALLAGSCMLAMAEDREAKVHEDVNSVREAGYWIYNDLGKGFALAESTGQPMLVVFRCVP